MDTDFFLSSRPAYPWSVYPLGFPALVLVAVLLVVFTLWTYLGHPQATRRRVTIVLALRLAALAVTLLTAVRPSVGVQETPNVPSVLLIGIDESESMKTADETGQPRIAAVKETLKKCQPILDELAEQKVEVVVYRFSTPDFQPDTAKFDPQDEATGKRSDYGTYLNRSHDRWQGEQKPIRGHILIGDGRDNGLAFSAYTEAGRWGRRGVAVTTVGVGDPNSLSEKKDIRVVSLSCVPRSAPLKTDVEVVAEVNAYNFRNEPVKARVYVDDQPVLTEEVTLTKPTGNLIRMKIKAPEKPGEVKVRLAVGREENPNGVPTIVPVPGELDRDRADNNNSKRTRLTVTKEGVRVLVVDRLRWENTLYRDALRGEKRFDVVQVIRQAEDLRPTADERKYLDLDANAYDVVVIGNIPIGWLTKQFDGKPLLDLAKVVERVDQKGMGLMFLGGERAFEGLPPPPPGDPRQRGLAFADIVPVTVKPGDVVAAAEKEGQPVVPNFYQFVPTEKGFEDRLLRIAPDVAKSKEFFDELNFARNFSRVTGYNRFVARPGASVYAWASLDVGTVKAGTAKPAAADPLLVGLKTGTEDRGRVLAFAPYDSYMWQRFGQPVDYTGVDIFTKFWRQCVLWLAHQEEEEGQVYARPEFPELAAGGTQTVRVGLKAPDGGDDPDAVLTVKVLGPGDYDPKDLRGRSLEAAARDENSSVYRALQKAQPRTVERDQAGSKVTLRPTVPGEYVVVVSTPAYKIGPDGRPERGPDMKFLRDPDKLYIGGAGFDVEPEDTDETLIVAADPEFLARIAGASGGKSIRLEDLPAFLRELKQAGMPNLRPRPKFVPDWRRNHSKGFLPLWLVLFTALLGTEWGLRRLWGMV